MMMVIIIIELVKIFFLQKDHSIDKYLRRRFGFFFWKSIKKNNKIVFVSLRFMSGDDDRRCSGSYHSRSTSEKNIYAVIMIMTTMRSFNQASQCLKITIDTSLALGGGGGFQLYRDNHVFFLFFCFHFISTRFFSGFLVSNSSDDSIDQCIQ